MDNELSEKIKLYCNTSDSLFDMFKHEFQKDDYLNSIWEWAPWIKTMKDCRVYHAHIMFRLVQKRILEENPKYELAKDKIYGFLQKVFEDEYPDLDLETGRIIKK